MKNHVHTITLNTAQCRAAMTSLKTCSKFIRKSSAPRALEESMYLDDVVRQIMKQMNHEITL